MDWLRRARGQMDWLYWDRGRMDRPGWGVSGHWPSFSSCFSSGGHSPRPVLMPSHMFHAADSR